MLVQKESSKTLTFPAGVVLCTNCSSRIPEGGFISRMEQPGKFVNRYSVIEVAHTLALRQFRTSYSIKKSNWWPSWERFDNFGFLICNSLVWSTAPSTVISSAPALPNHWKMQTKLSTLIHFCLNNIFPQHNGGCCNILPAVWKLGVLFLDENMEHVFPLRKSKLIVC